MASIVKSGNNNLTYTNNVSPAQNVRVVINYMSNCTKMTWGQIGSTTGIATVTSSSTTIIKDRDLTNFPSEIVLGSLEILSCTCGAYNIVIIKEDGT